MSGLGERVRALPFRLGLSCYSPEEVRALDTRWDAILMAHVIEHFSPADLLQFLDSYLDRLTECGFLVIATPTDWPLSSRTSTT